MDHFYAHTRRNRPPDSWDLLLDHLRATADLTENFARAFGPQAGYLVGLWHDLGKFRPEFQQYLLRSAEAGHEEGRGPEHSIVGAWHARDRLDRTDLAMIIAAHHGRLAKRSEFLNKVERGAALHHSAPVDLLVPRPAELPSPSAETLWIRFLFSALVDADSLETERWDKGVSRWRCTATIDELTAALEQHLATKRESTEPSPMNDLRRVVQSACAERSTDAMGAFRLTVPTGGGKTLASLLFALHHARHHGLQRIIVVIPYTSIIDQTVQVFRAILGDDAVIEHHSNIDPSAEGLVNRHCVENWDSPVIVTTSVQFFETLHGNRKRDLRKLHRVAESVVVLDEVQTFPLELIKPIKESLDKLIRHFRVTTVHCSATQPLLAQPDAREIVVDPPALFAATRNRVRVNWPNVEQPTTWEALAERIRGHSLKQVLAIVHAKRDAIELARAVGEDCIHLSTLMCPAHRRRTLARIQRSLRAGLPCAVVSTQLVEAGVDLDFPVVYRALAGIDSLAQAAGRCNREGRLASAGEFHVFLAPTEPPRGTLRDGFKRVRNYLRDGAVDLFDPSLPARYFKALVDVKGYVSDIPALERSWDFPEVERLFQMIEDHGTPVIAPFGDRWFDDVQAAQDRPSIQTFRRLQQYTVSLPDRWLTALNKRGVLAELFPASDGPCYVLPGQATIYSARFGFGGEGDDDLPFMEA